MCEEEASSMARPPSCSLWLLLPNRRPRLQPHLEQDGLLVQLKPTGGLPPVPTPTMPTACAPRHHHRPAAADPATQDIGPSGGSTGDTWMRAREGVPRAAPRILSDLHKGLP